ncbi:MAG TPA: hypothetical protein PLV59_02115 [Candidatus Dojkabacteria bacterium]|nr:hypothetical protein [Candidatus Dojkabacteria bacterium]
MKNYQKFLKYLSEVLIFWKDGVDWIQYVILFSGMSASVYSLLVQKYSNLILLFSAFIFLFYSTYKVYLRYKIFDIEVEYEQIRKGTSFVSYSRTNETEYKIPYYIHNYSDYDIYIERIIINGRKLDWYGKIKGSASNRLNLPVKVNANTSEHFEKWIRVFSTLALREESDRKIYDTKVYSEETPEIDVEIVLKTKEGQKSFSRTYVLADLFLKP